MLGIETQVNRFFESFRGLEQLIPIMVIRRNPLGDRPKALVFLSAKNVTGMTHRLYHSDEMSLLFVSPAITEITIFSWWDLRSGIQIAARIDAQLVTIFTWQLAHETTISPLE
jgi:hypothetical protein